MRRREHRGTALVAALIFALILGLTCASIVILSVANTSAGQNGIRRAAALSAAEIGVERAKAGIAQGLFDSQFSAQNHQAAATSEVCDQAGKLYGNYAVHVTGDYGGVSGQYLIISQGTSGSSTRQVRVVVRRVPLEVPNPLAAITLYNPNALASFRGVPPNVCGLDTNLPVGIPFSSARASDCVAGSGDGPDGVGVGVHDDQSVVDIMAALGSRTSRITGTDGAGGSEPASVYNVGGVNPTGQTDPLTAADIVSLADVYAKAAHYVYDGQSWYDGEGHPAPDGNFGTTSSPKVVVVRSSGTDRIHLAGSWAGVGVLVIDCEVEFTGTFNYAGLVVITRRGDATVSVEMMGTPLVMGAMVAANPGDEATSVLDLRGTADVFFSRQALEYARQALSSKVKFEPLFYTEERPDPKDLEVQW